MSGHSCTVVSWNISFTGAYTDSGYSVATNEIRARYVSNADSRFGGGAGLQLPKMGSDAQGEPVVIVPQVQLTSEQIATIQGVIEEAMTATQFGACDFGVAPPVPSE